MLWATTQDLPWPCYRFALGVPPFMLPLGHTPPLSVPAVTKGASALALFLTDLREMAAGIGQENNTVPTNSF